MSRPHFVSSSVALAYDSKNDRIVRVVVSIDLNGRRWESYDGGPDVLIEPPDEPDQSSKP